MKKIICIFILLLIFVIYFGTKSSEVIIKDNIIISQDGEKILKGEKEYIFLDNLDHEKNYLKITNSDKISIEKRGSNYFLISEDKKNKIFNEINLGSDVKAFKLDNNLLYYVKTNEKNKNILYEIDVRSKKNEKLVELEYIDEYLVDKDIIFLNEMGIYYKFNKKTKEKKHFDFGGKLFDFNEKELFFYKREDGNKICFFRINKNFKKNNCDLEVPFDDKKEYLLDKPLKLKEGIYVLKFAKRKRMSYLYKKISIFNLTIFKIPVSKLDYASEIYLRVIDLKKNKIIIKKMKV